MSCINKLFKVSVPIRFGHSSAGRFRLKETIDKRIKDIKQAGTYKSERIITSPQSMDISVRGTNENVLNFCANNYLGLSNNEDIKKSGIKAIEEYGNGVSSVRFICGTQSIHKDLEAKISKFHSRDDAILYASCFDANAGLFEAFLKPEDAVFSDSLNHASIIDGLRLCKAQKHRYKHRDLAELESMLRASDADLKLIVTDGVFSMDGTVAPLAAIVDLANQYGALTFVDDSHATGFFGKTGRGTEEYCEVLGEIDIINSTLGKALGGAIGGYTTGPDYLIDLLRQVSRPYLFSNSLPPVAVGSACQVFDMLQDSSELCQKVEENTKLFRTEMLKAGFKVNGDNHPICPVMLGDAKLASEFSSKMLKRGIYVIGFSYPVVPKGAARVRVQLSAAHTTQQIERAIKAFCEVGRELKVIS